MVRILSNFLHNREAYIKINNTKGPIFKLEAGVPQGDVLSPTLFLIMCNDYPDPTYIRTKRNFNMQYADDFTQIIINKFTGKINDARRELHRKNIQTEIDRQNRYEKKWKLKTNAEKFQIIAIGYIKNLRIYSEGKRIRYTTKAKLLGLNFTNYNFFTRQMDINIDRAIQIQRRLWRFRTLKKNLKTRLYKSLILPIMLYPIIPLNACSKTQMARIQRRQNEAIRWICNEKWPLRCPIEERHRELKIEYIADRIKRMAEGIWSNLEEENNEFYRETIQIQMINPHASYPSSYERTFE